MLADPATSAAVRAPLLRHTETCAMTYLILEGLEIEKLLPSSFSTCSWIAMRFGSVIDYLTSLK